MLSILGKIPNDNFVIACSGGPDSMALADFCYRGKKRFDLVFIHHNTAASDAGLYAIQRWLENKKDINLHSFRIKTKKETGQSQEEFWREERYKFLQSFNKLILTAHHLDDVIETWIFSSFHGNPYLIPYKNHKRNVIRPLLTTKKKKLLHWCIHKNVFYAVDESNDDVSFARNRIRHNIVPEAMKINPGLHKVLCKKIIKEYDTLQKS